MPSRTDKDYSATPLYKKLGIKPGHHVGIASPPEGFVAGFEVPAGAIVHERATRSLDVILFFADSRSQLRRRFDALVRWLDSSGGFWIAYPKKSSSIRSDLGFDSVQEFGLSAGLVDNKSCAVDQDWTAVRFVYRLSDRPRR